ncbi:MAG TPA: aldolase/citrate lyase family protein [Paracoccaceae bacterium]|nr:aldolase/citrate lyase family protein [Paracoccaceae bacterium]
MHDAGIGAVLVVKRAIERRPVRRALKQRGARFGLAPDYAASANDGIGVILQVETAAALAQVEAIAAVPGVDVLFIGPADLAASMGLPGQPGHPAVRAAVLDGLARIAAAGLNPGVLTLDAGFARECVAAGSRFTAVGIDTALLLGAARGLAAAWRG